MPNIVIFILSIVPIPISYYLYRRYSLDRLSIGRSIDSFLYGIITAALLVIINPAIEHLLPKGSEFARAFFHASLLEKMTAFISLYIILKYVHKETSVPESITAGIFYAIGFSGLENIFYAYEFQKIEVLLRLFSSVPLHLTTCSIMGYFLGLHFMSSSKLNRGIYLTFSLVFPIIFHALYDTALLKGAQFTYFIGPELVLLITVQEYIIAKSTSLPKFKDLRIKKVTFEDWHVIRRQVEYERWILRSMGKRNVETVPFFEFSFTRKRTIVTASLIIFSIFFLFLREKINLLFSIQLKFEEQITLFVLYPLVGGFNLFLAGSINHDYFKNSIFSLPIVAEIILSFQSERQELNGTDITRDSCFIKTLDSFEVGQKVEFVYSYSEKISPTIRANVIWDNHENLLEPIGTLFRVENRSKEYYKFLLQYRLFRWTRGMIFNLKIPGFESLRNHFVKAITVMEDHAYVAEGTILFMEGDKGREFYFLKRGIVEIYKTTEMGEDVVLSIIEPGNIFGEMSMITGHPRAATAVCKTNCLISTADGDNLETLVMNNPQFSYKLLQTLANRLSRSEGILMNRIQNLETEIQILREQNAIFQEYFNHPEWDNNEKSANPVDEPKSPTKDPEPEVLEENKDSESISPEEEIQEKVHPATKSSERVSHASHKQKTESREKHSSHPVSKKKSKRKDKNKKDRKNN